jgi:deazaflavin-dependent oxidoreductase (nitroreductase family)
MNEPVVHDENFGKWWWKLFNGFLKMILRAGLKPRATYLLSVKGRKTGAIHSTPVIIVEAGSERYLVAPYGPVNWVRNARAAGIVTLTRGRKAEALHTVEVGPEESASVLKRYVAMASATHSCFKVVPDSPLEEYIAEAAGHPVFRLVA